MTEVVHDTNLLNAYADPPAELRATSFGKLYQDYVTDRTVLHEKELQRHDPNAADLHLASQAKVVRMHRETLAEAAIYLFDACSDARTFTKHIASAIREREDPRDDDTVIFDGFVTPPSLHETMPSPVEACVVTAENKCIAQEFARVGEHTLTGLIISGANAWGAFYATRGVHPKLEEPSPLNRSDLDLLAIVPEIDDIGETLAQYVDAGLIKEAELERFDDFRRLQRLGLADVFSLRSNYKGFEQSVHFLTHEMTHAITALHPIHQREHDGQNINYLKDYRPNLPNNPGKNGGGYTIDDLKGLYIGRRFDPHLEATPQGYISESPVGSILTIEGQRTYSLGVLDFFLAIKPDIIYDPQKKAEVWVRTLQDTIAHIQGTEKPKNIPRMIRMPKGALRSIEHSVSLARDE